MLSTPWTGHLPEKGKERGEVRFFSIDQSPSPFLGSFSFFLSSILPAHLTVAHDVHVQPAHAPGERDGGRGRRQEGGRVARQAEAVDDGEGFGFHG